mmetsp:Transcript_20096/g.29824  ORF Transcript_20096/g.29824 Transcript_20096/m.29824 type:complete len:230 (-) Transcript_20096:426-1115(-)|eukprot:CAMPEP_0194214406 /NCGR_PEP_ID=MMETSP0156-20130528/15567_1 /TAXON_ID=33649 /ORGANISM="Thalassionema nitzschioides, Strain L26-B" /LENGTH=229 /DNA_ID=CAMNT_0038942649 /DNA_START=27 /DNA_END=716 /DNA_ORIENTATION=-
MGRYSSAKAYGDNNAQMRSISYEQASGSAKDKPGSVSVEKVHNPYGSTAGAGSGEFHVYRHARAREAERWKQLNEEEKEKMQDKEYQDKLAQDKIEEEQRTERRRRKRQRQKEAKLKKKNLKISGVNLTSGEKKDQAEVEEDEFTYVATSRQIIENAPEAKINAVERTKEIPENEAKRVDEGLVNKARLSASESVPVDATAFPNDGSFVELMKKKLTQKGGEKQSPEDL